jgi:hypothetical protein
VDTIVGWPRFLADDDDPVSLVAASFDERLAEMVTDHAVADNDKGLSDATHLGDERYSQLAAKAGFGGATLAESQG